VGHSLAHDTKALPFSRSMLTVFTIGHIYHCIVFKLVEFAYALVATLAGLSRFFNSSLAKVRKSKFN
jgi:hypothetical protein